MWKKAIKIIPDGNTLLSKRPQLWLPRKWPTHFISSKNITLIDHKKKRYKDFLFAVGTNVLGYSNTKVDRQVSKAISKGNMTSINAIEEYQLAEKLIQINPWAGMVKFARAGGDANAIAIRIARAASGKNNVAFCGYHGWHDWYVATNLTNKNGLNNHLIDGIKTYGVNKKLNKTIYPFLYNDFKNLKKLIENKKIGTVIMEVKRYEEPKNNFLKKIRDICNKKNIVLIFDECTTGFRQTFGGLYKEYSVIPDIIMYGKALGNGYAINAVVGKKSIMQYAKKSFISSTFWGERLGFVAGLASIEEMKRVKSWKQVKETGNYVIKKWKKIAEENKIKISIKGLESIPTMFFDELYHAEFRTLIASEMLKKNMLASNLFYISTKHTKKDINNYLEHLFDIFRLMRKIQNRGDSKKFKKNSNALMGISRLN